MNLDDLLRQNDINPHQLTNKKSFCYTPSYAVCLLVNGFLSNEINHTYKIYKNEPTLCSEILLSGKTDLGLISAIDYEVGKGSWLIVPNTAISCGKGSFWATLFIKEGIKSIKKVAVDRHARNEFALLKIILQERYEIEADFSLVEPQIDDMLSEHDAALLIGDQALHNLDKYPTHIDICEEWYDMSGLPFVISFWAGQEMSLNTEDIALINQAKAHGEYHLDKIINNYAAENRLQNILSGKKFKDTFSLGLQDEEKTALKEFYQYAFYLGIIDNSPELHFFED